MKGVENIVAKGELLIMRLLRTSHFSFCPTVSTWINYYTFIYQDIPYICFDDFKVFCCKIVLFGKGLKQSMRLEKYQKTTVDINIFTTINNVMEIIGKEVIAYFKFSKLQYTKEIPFLFPCKSTSFSPQLSGFLSVSHVEHLSKL